MRKGVRDKGAVGDHHARADGGHAEGASLSSVAVPAIDYSDGPS